MVTSWLEAKRVEILARRRRMRKLAAIGCAALVASCMDTDPSTTIGATPAETAARFFEIRDENSWTQMFSDPGTDGWTARWFLDGETGKISNSRDGMIVTAGPDINDNGDSVVLWTKESFQGDIRIEYDYTRLDQMTRHVNILYIQASGTGIAPYVEDISAWAELRKPPFMRKYFLTMNLLQISYATKRHDVDGEYVRARLYPVPPSGTFRKDTEISESYFNTDLFKPLVTYHITAIKSGERLFFHVDGDGKNRLFQWEISTAGAPSRGRVGLRHMPGRQARYANLKVWVR